jgi:hypothetical protein
MPLFVGKDLDEDVSREVAAHISRCVLCAELEAGLRRSRNWLREAPPPVFGEQDYANLRRGVWRRIESAAAARSRGNFGRVVLAGSAILSLLFAAILFLRSLPADFEPPRPSAVVRAPGPAIPPPPLDPPGGVSSRRETRAGGRARLDRPRGVPRRPPAALEHEDFVRIEFQTSHPNVRIIWLVRKQEVS